MGYPTIDKFDIKFIKRTKTNVKSFDHPNTFTHLINSLIGLIFVPHEFHKKGRRKYKIDFLNEAISNYQILVNIFSGTIKLFNEQGKVFTQKKSSIKMIKMKRKQSMKQQLEI